MKRFLTIAFLIFSVSSLTAFSPIRQDVNSIIVQFSNSVSENSILELDANKFYTVTPLNIEKTLYKIAFNPLLTSTYQVVEIVNKHPYYFQYQEDGKIEMRATTPNDTLFPYQWHLPLIKATEAWDLSRKGVTRNGDTIVIAVIDDGLHTNHPDFQGNIWINYADTANNGIDDDGNGFIDDHYGWNFMGKNNDISDSNYYKALHGTPVCGIIGARGNNITGVSGIMWNVKLMVVNFTDTGRFPQVFQSDVVKAYQYVLHQRKLYNSSNGAQGAYVVATNSSWGANGKFPHQAPIWCAMYDSLGKYGILNVSAVTNAQSQVDVDGDLPTLCPSAHLITVGSTTSSDAYFSCGFSPTSVDISAPGANIYSTAAYTKENIQIRRIYRGSFSGTSFASPMVAAAIGVLQSHACDRLLDTFRVNPIKGNELLKKFILESADPVQSLEGLSVSGGRLNIKKSLEMMGNYCLGYLGVNELENVLNISIFPNPGNGSIEILSDLEIEQVLCYDINGKQHTCLFENGSISISHLAVGVYFLHIQTESGIQVIKYLKTE